MKEYIVAVEDDVLAYEEYSVGYIRRQKKLIRCKDCKHRYTERGMGFCEKLDNMFYHFNDSEPIDADFYCKWAERKEDGK